MVIISNNITHLRSQANKLNLFMPKYILIGLIVIIGLFLILNFWSKLDEKTKNKSIAAIFGIIMIGFIVLISLLIL